MMPTPAPLSWHCLGKATGAPKSLGSRAEKEPETFLPNTLPSWVARAVCFHMVPSRVAESKIWRDLEDLIPDPSSETALLQLASRGLIPVTS